MKHKGYDGHNGLGLQKNGMIEPLIPPKWPKNIGLGKKPLKVGAPSTKVLSTEEVSSLKDI